MQRMTQKRITIDPEVISENNLSMGEFLFTLSYMLGFDFELVGEEMVEKKLARYEGNKIVPSLIAHQRVQKILNPEGNVTMKEDEILDLATKMKELYLKGYQSIGIPWAEGPKLIAKRLENFFRKYGNYKAEDILQATKDYVSAKRGTLYMKTLKNFIYKDIILDNGFTDVSSDLYNWLEMDANERLQNEIDWDVDLRD